MIFAVSLYGQTFYPIFPRYAVPIGTLPFAVIVSPKKMMNKSGRTKHPNPNLGEQPNEEKRCGRDRRTNHKARLKYFLRNGRRGRNRREDDRHKIFLFDRYNFKIFAAVVTILVLSILDAILTLILIDNGSSELNPVMEYFLQQGVLPFVIAKYLLTSSGVIILLIFKNVFITQAKIYAHSLFSAVIIAFAAVIAWEIFLISMID